MQFFPGCSLGLFDMIAISTVVFANIRRPKFNTLYLCIVESLSEKCRLVPESQALPYCLRVILFQTLKRERTVYSIYDHFLLQLCKTCSPPVEHIRLFDVTQRTGLRKHRTGRKCTKCRRAELQDSIVHFGEKGPLHSPYNWKQAARAADEAQLVICLGTSLKVGFLSLGCKPIYMYTDIYI